MPLFTRKHYFMLSRVMGSGSRRRKTRYERQQTASLFSITFWLLLGIAILWMVPTLQEVGAEVTTSVVSAATN